MDLAKHISDLLFKTDRVVVPGLGVFFTKYIPAKIHTAKQTVEPPSKEILFTSAIKDDNGLLIKYISENKGIKEEIAKEELEKYVKQYNINLSEGKKLKFVILGTLSRKNLLRVKQYRQQRKRELKNHFGSYMFLFHLQLLLFLAFLILI